MSFQEKSSWVVVIALLIGGVFYFATVITLSTPDTIIPPVFPFVIVYTLILIVIAIVGHIIAAVLAPKDANASEDERDKEISRRATNFASHVFSFAVICSLGLYMLTMNGHILFYLIFASLMIAQTLEYLAKLVLYRSVI